MEPWVRSKNLVVEQPISPVSKLENISDMVGEPPSTPGQLWLKSWKDTLSNNHQFIITCSSYTDDTKNAIISCIHPNSLCWQKDKVVTI
jgi:hypothetical protein